MFAKRGTRRRAESRSECPTLGVDAKLWLCEMPSRNENCDECSVKYLHAEDNPSPPPTFTLDAFAIASRRRRHLLASRFPRLWEPSPTYLLHASATFTPRRVKRSALHFLAPSFIPMLPPSPSCPPFFFRSHDTTTPWPQQCLIFRADNVERRRYEIMDVLAFAHLRETRSQMPKRPSV